MSVVDIRIIGLDKLTADIERIRNDASFRWPEEILDGSAEMMADEIRDQAPRGPTSRLANSVRIEKTHDKRSVIVDSPYGVFQNDGTGPSPGRYVRAIGKRLKSQAVSGISTGPGGDIWFRITPAGERVGMHPGVPATHFFDNAVSYATPRIIGFVHRKLYEYLME